MLRIVPHVGSCHIFHRIILRKASGAQCAPYEDLFDNLKFSWQYRIILSADTASEVRQLLSQKRR